eukprot:15459116-Alexandrium_andersonii.AAC.1
MARSLLAVLLQCLQIKPQPSSVPATVEQHSTIASRGVVVGICESTPRSEGCWGGAGASQGENDVSPRTPWGGLRQGGPSTRPRGSPFCPLGTKGGEPQGAKPTVKSPGSGGS